MTTLQQPAENLAWYALSPEAAAGQMGVDPDQGLDAEEAERRLAEYGPNELATEPPPSVWVVAPGPAGQPDEHHAADRGRGQLRDRPDRRRPWWCWGW